MTEEFLLHLFSFQNDKIKPYWLTRPFSKTFEIEVESEENCP